MTSISNNIEGKFNVILNLDVGLVPLDNNDIMNCYYVEDIFSFCLNGKLRFVDNKGIFEFGPITGNESLFIIYGNHEDIELEFLIWKINKVEQDVEIQSQSQVFEIIFVDPIYYNLNLIKYSRSWKDKKISEIVKDISKNMLNIPTGNKNWHKFENTKETLEYFYMPYWTPRMALSWLLKRGTSEKNSQPGFLYYTNSRGRNYVTLENLLSQTDLMKTDPEGDDGGLYVYESQDLYYLNKIFKWQISGMDNSALSSLLGGNRLGFDSMNKKFIRREFEYKDGIDNQTILGRKSLFSDYSDSRANYLNTGEGDKNIIDNIWHSYFNKKYVLQNCASFIVKGQESRYAGGIIEVNWKSFNKDEVYNKNLSGKYLVKSITHSFGGESPPYYKQKMICIKNGYENSDSRNLLKSSKKNLGE